MHLQADVPWVVVGDRDRDGVVRLRDTLMDHGLKVTIMCDGLDLYSIVAEGGVDLLIVGDLLPRPPDGVAVCRRVRSMSQLPVVLLGVDSLDRCLTAFRAGADDVVRSDVTISEIVARVQALLRRSLDKPTPRYQIAGMVIDARERRVWCDGDIALTYTEFEVLHALARARGGVVGKRDLLREIWGGVHDVNLVEAHVSGLRRKLASHGQHVVHTVRGAGYALRA